MINQPSTPISNDIATLLKAMVQSNRDFSGIGNLYSKLNKLDNRQSALESRLTDKYGWENDASDSLKVHYNEEDDVSEMSGYTPIAGAPPLKSRRDYFNPEILPESDNISQFTEITGGTSIDTNMSDKPFNSDFKPQLNIFQSPTME